MLHYHGTPIGGKRADLGEFFPGRHALVPWRRAEDVGAVAAACRSFCFDNSAFSAWRSGKPITDWQPYYAWVDEWRRHPGFDWAIIPDIIDGNEEANDELLGEWPFDVGGVPVWHLHESFERLERLVVTWPRIALGSSGSFAKIGTPAWWRRISDAMEVACDENGNARTKLHGLRMLNPAVYTRIPLASADSTNIAQNSARKAMEWQCAVATARVLEGNRIEMHNSATIWKPLRESKTLCFMGTEQDG